MARSITVCDSDEIREKVDMYKNDIPDSVLAKSCDYLDLETLWRINPSLYNLKILHLNIRSLISKQDALRSLLVSLKTKQFEPDLILLCETYLRDAIEKFVNIPGYRLICKNRKNSKNGGVGILVKDNINYKIREDLSEFYETEFETCFVEITHTKGKNLVIGSLYRVPGKNEKIFMKRYQNLMEKIMNRNNVDLIVGIDQNLDYVKMDSHNNTSKFFDLNIKLGLLPVITRPTRITKNTATLIDNIYISSALSLDYNSGIYITDISDHMISMLLCNRNNKAIRVNERIKRSINKNTLSNIRQELNMINWYKQFDRSQHVNYMSDKFANMLTHILDKYAPMKVVKNVTVRRHPWITDSIVRCSHRCLKLYKKTIKKGANNTDIIEYKRYRNILNRVKRRAKSQYFTKKFNEYKTKTRKTWQLINNFIKKSPDKSGIISKLIHNDKEYNNGEEMANEFGKYFSQIGTKMEKKIPMSKKDIKHYNSKIPRTIASLFLTPTTRTEIKKRILALPSKCSSGHDNIDNILLKKINDIALNTS